MNLNERNSAILDALLSNPSISSALIEKKFGLSKRQLGYSIQKINSWLKQLSLPLIERTSQGQFLIDEKVFTALNHVKETAEQNHSSILTVRQRTHLLLCMLISKDYLTLDHFSIALHISRNTILRDLKNLQKQLEPFQLHIRYGRKLGYYIEGNEFQLRKALMSTLIEFLESDNILPELIDVLELKEDCLYSFRDRIEQVEKKLSIKFTDEKMKTMPLTLFLILQRIRKGARLTDPPISYKELAGTKEYQAAEELLFDQEGLPEAEKLFITLHLLSANVVTTEMKEEDAIPDLYPAVDSMLSLFEKVTCIRMQERKQLLHKLMQHIKPAYYRIKYNLTDTTPVPGVLNGEFRSLHQLVKRSLEPLELFIESEIPENEQIYITLLIGGWIRQQGESIGEKVKAIVVCPQGVSVSKLMFHELSGLFPEFIFLDSMSVREFITYDLEYDIVFSPVLLETSRKLFITKTVLDTHEKRLLRKQVLSYIHGFVSKEVRTSDIIQIISNHATVKNKEALEKELQAYLTQVDEHVVKTTSDETQQQQLCDFLINQHLKMAYQIGSWEDAVRSCAGSLLDKGNIEPRYIDAMIKSCEKDPYIVIGPGIAIPHASPEDGVVRTGMSLLKIKNGVQYLGYRIHILVVIAAKDKKEHIHALMQLMKLSKSEADLKKLIDASGIPDMRRIIQQYSDDVVKEKEFYYG
ncbi:BglG family transcription antiterminator [Terribacillus saccharophilus]|uniref:Ascorbate-specific PTS system EIIA component n=1 Tax=Terribacillus saccharophilus TaxID=361277 RepID=A0ABX4GU40_9BACI|nr:BglG family transcription antiterminator [Terribacillus saccharophilus]PAD33918.1 transcription antiterminator BglG [Terribacillus saccharophilus]PAD94654.1 transcription antiterminator BglG [Terribacillus saccharophilus]PAD98382.1 transcription antiterminator BglG [Terribacillus saccharophilus]